MSPRGSFFIRFLVAIFLVALFVGAAGLAYRAGFSQGYAQAVVVAQGEGRQVVPGVPIYPGYWGPHFGFFPFFPLCGVFFFGLFFLFALRFLFRPWHWGYAGHWHRHPEEWGTPPWAKEHTEQKQQPETETGEPGKSNE
jgi:hypothetical protein